MRLQSEIYTRWWDEAACKSHPTPVIFFPSSGQTDIPAKLTCGSCTVTVECLDYAMTHREPGIWGGTNERDRNKLRRHRG